MKKKPRLGFVSLTTADSDVHYSAGCDCVSCNCDCWCDYDN